MIIRGHEADSSYQRISNQIKKDLVLCLREKGVDVQKIEIDLKPGNVNLEVLIREN